MTAKERGDRARRYTSAGFAVALWGALAVWLAS